MQNIERTVKPKKYRLNRLQSVKPMLSYNRPEGKAQGQTAAGGPGGRGTLKTEYRQQRKTGKAEKKLMRDLSADRLLERFRE